LALLLMACAPDSAPGTPTEIPATEVPVEVVVENTTTPQTEVMVFFRYSYTNVIPRSFFLQGTDVERETVTFHKVAGNWQSKDLKPQTAELGPLFGLYVTKFEYSNPDCLFKGDYNEIITQFEVVPTCETIPSELSVEVEFGIENCERASFGSLVCQIETENGSLRYALNGKIDKFQFIVDGMYNFVYEDWIRMALAGLGFDPLPENYFDDIMPGQNNVILKSSQGVEGQ